MRGLQGRRSAACPSCRASPIDRRFCEEIEAAHRLARGNVAEIARRLGLSRTTVYKHLRRSIPVTGDEGV